MTEAIEVAAPAIDLSKWSREVIALEPAADALQFEGRWRTWGWLGGAIEALDALLTDAGFGAEVKVGVLMRNRPEIVRSIVGSLATRRCLVTLSSAIPVAKLAGEVERMRPPVVIACEQDWADPTFSAAVRSAGSLGLVARDTEPAFGVVVPVDGRTVGAADLAAGVAVQMLTSGTTGPPKRIDLTYRSLEHEIVSTARYSARGAINAPRLSSGTSLVWNPLLHIGGLRGLITALVAGRKVALLERFSVDGWAALVHEHRPKAISLVPATLAMVHDADLPRSTFESVSAVFSGTAPLDPELARRFEERYGVPVLVVYGATEFAGGVAGWTLADWRRYGSEKAGSVGRPNAGVEVRVVDQESGAELPRGEVGLLEVRAPQLPQAGWMRTTDLARMDGDDFIWITGRVDDVIVRGGFKVAAGEVRAVIVEHPAVQDACVFGIDDRRLGQVPVAAVELRPDSEPVTAADLLRWARERLSAYQVPTRLVLVDELPRTPSLKISQGALRPLFVDAEE